MEAFLTDGELIMAIVNFSFFLLITSIIVMPLAFAWRKKKMFAGIALYFYLIAMPVALATIIFIQSKRPTCDDFGCFILSILILLTTPMYLAVIYKLTKDWQMSHSVK
jgi:hypothetical protein